MRSYCGEEEGAAGVIKDGKREKPRASSDVKLREVTITVVPKMRGKEEGNGFSSFKPSKKLLRSPTVSERRELVAGDDSKGGELSSGVSEHSTPIAVRSNKGDRCLVRRAMERSTYARYGNRLPVDSEAEESAREDIDAPYGEDDEEEEVIDYDGRDEGVYPSLVGSSTDALCVGKKETW